jgi:hypothetical protein
MVPKGIPRNSRTEASFMEGEVIPLIVPKLGILTVVIVGGNDGTGVARVQRP